MEPAPEDVRQWIGRLTPGRSEEHARFLDWLRSPEGQEIFRRRRLTEYTLAQEGDQIEVQFKAPHTGDPRIMIDFLRYPGVWPEFWEFQRGGVPAPEEQLTEASQGVMVHWRKPAVDEV